MGFLGIAVALLGLAVSLTPHAADARPLLEAPGYLADAHQTGGRRLQQVPLSLGPISYLGGEVLTDEVHIYPIYVGYKSNQDEVPFVLNHMMVNMNGHPLWNVVTRYSQTDASGAQKFVSGRITLANILYIETLDTPIALVFDQMLDQLFTFVSQLISNGKLPNDPQGVYMVIGGQNGGLAPPPELLTDGHACAFNGFATGSFKFGYVPEYVGVERCQWPNLSGVNVVSPLNNHAIDAMANFLFSTLANIVTDPTLQGWIDAQRAEVGGKCVGVAQLTTDPNFGYSYSQLFGGVPYLVQDLWNVDPNPNPSPNLIGPFNQIGCSQGIL